MLRALITCCAILLALCAVAQVCSLPTPTVLTQVTGPVKVVVIPVCVASHWFQSLAIIKELSHRGHSLQVVLSDDFAAKWGHKLAQLPNISFISYNTSGHDEMALRQTLRATQRSVGIQSIREVFGMPQHSQPLLQDLHLQDKIQNFRPDLALVDAVMVGGLVLADKLGIPKVELCVAGDLAPVIGHAFGSGASLMSTVPAWNSHLPRNMTFWQRVQNTLIYLTDMCLWCFVIEPEMDKMWQQYNIPPYSYVKSNRQAPLILMHHDWATTPANPMGPHMFATGTITAAPANALPADLETFMESAGEHGVVFASLGTTAIPEAAELNAIAKGLAAVAPTKVLWKLSESDLVESKNMSLSIGSNVKIVKWVPQNDVLGHRNVKVFFTQGGSNSFNEASYHGVPIVGMPLCCEQPDNIARAMDQGYGLSVSVKQLNTLAEDLEISIKRILTNPSFGAKAYRISSMMRAHRRSPVERVADAMEHTAWTNGSRHLQPLRDELNWFQTNSLDVMLLLTSVGLAVFYSAVATLTYISKAAVRIGSRQPESQHVKNA